MQNVPNADSFRKRPVVDICEKAAFNWGGKNVVAELETGNSGF